MDINQSTLGGLKAKVDILYEEREEVKDFIKKCISELANLDNKIEHNKELIDNINLKIKELDKTNIEINRWRERILGVVIFISLITAFISGGLQKLVILLQ